MVLLIVLLDALQQFFHTFWTVSEHFPHSQRDLPDSFVSVCTEWTVHVLMFVDVKILVGCVLALFLLNAHQELVHDDLLCVLVGSDAGVDELYDFADVFCLDDVGHDVWHYVADCLEVLLLELDQSCLEQLD